MIQTYEKRPETEQVIAERFDPQTLLDIEEFCRQWEADVTCMPLDGWVARVLVAGQQRVIRPGMWLLCPKRDSGWSCITEVLTDSQFAERFREVPS